MKKRLLNFTASPVNANHKARKGMKRSVRLFLLVVIGLFAVKNSFAQMKLFNDGWEFSKDVDTVVTSGFFVKNSSLKWNTVSLPHTANIEPVEKVVQQWQGTCFYRKFFWVPITDKGKHIAVQFDAAMHEADVYLNGHHLYKHLGGYLPFYIDLSEGLTYGDENVLLVKLNNNDNPIIPPGKPLKDLDFNYYSGIYRNVWFIAKNSLHISNAVAANRKAGGGVTIHYENISDKAATLLVQTDVKNDLTTSANAQIKILLADETGKVVAQTTSSKQKVEEAGFGTFAQQLIVAAPKLWSPDAPHLYRLAVTVLRDGKPVDSDTIKTGIRSIRFEAGGFYLNEKKVAIRGTNRHQEYPFIGNALSDNAQYRDAYKIKQAGFNFVRTSHYPQSPAFLDACDELGILVMDAIPGWQFFGNDTFQQNSYQNLRDVLHRDRNHPSIILWEASLNESRMSMAYMQKAHAIVHEELPFSNVYSAGWLDEAYDVFLPARQHSKSPDYWKKYSKTKPLLIAEYGDWEYYAGNAGFSQKEYADLKKEERSSRQLRGAGEKRLLQQALNYQESHNDNLYGPAVGDANWLMFDYKRGYAPDIESSGIMDIYRLPKPAFYFYASQADADVKSASLFSKLVLAIANHWRDASDTIIKIYSNCEEVELFVNGKSAGRQKPDKDSYSTNLKHPPFTFHLSMFSAGNLSAIGYIQNKKAARQVVMTPGEPIALRLRVDESGKQLRAGKNDAVFVYAEVVDKAGTVVSAASNSISFTVQGDAEIIGLRSVAAEAGIATILVKAGATPGVIKLTATATGLQSGELITKSKR